MGSTHFFHSSSSPINYPSLNPRYPLLSPNFYPQLLSLSSSKPNQRTTSDSIRTRIFEFDDDFRREKRRNWWSDDDDSDDDDEEDGGYEFGLFEDSNPFDWIFQVLKIFGWVVPAVIISSLLGTGTNSLIMAVVLPLGQTALSLVMDKFGGSPTSSSSSRPGYKSRRRPRHGSRSRPGARNARSRTSPGRGGYQSWRTANNSSVKTGWGNDPRFGGWDELDEQVGPTSDFSSKGQSREVNDPQSFEIGSGKLSRMQNRDKPLLMRLMIAVFPLLGSWTRFLL
ncbi:hypothetical protein KSS87_005573 [Heliosperma pusillum]|nr:hypothetical protein KSS87_005573 [Heliosperma pusillum]